MGTKVSSQSGSRLLSLDVFRGLTIAGMLMANNAGDWSHVFRPLEHAEWNGCTLTDLIFPFFVFAVGMSIALSIGKQRESGKSEGTILRKVLGRSVVIFLIGMALNLIGFLVFPKDDTYRPMGVLQRIAIAYLFASILFVYFKPRKLAFWLGGILTGYWLLFLMFPVPGQKTVTYERQGNAASYLDTKILGKYAYQYDAQTGWAHDPEGVPSSIPAIGTALCGCLAGIMVRRSKYTPDVARQFAILGTVGVAAGLVWSTVFPINKNLWTSSYVLFCAGWALLLLAILIYLLDVKGIRRGTLPFRALGQNAIFAFAGGTLMALATIGIKVPGPDGEPIFLKSWIYNNLISATVGSLLGNYWASAAYASLYVVIWTLLALALHKRGVIVKI